jgi:hypothetical protein
MAIATALPISASEAPLGNDLEISFINCEAVSSATALDILRASSLKPFATEPASDLDWALRSLVRSSDSLLSIEEDKSLPAALIESLTALDISDVSVFIVVGETVVPAPRDADLVSDMECLMVNISAKVHPRKMFKHNV